MLRADNSSEVAALNDSLSLIDNQLGKDKFLVEHAVILAAGKGERFQEKGVKLPKVLLKVGGLRLLERAVLGLNKAGVKHIYITVGAYREQIVEIMSQMESLQDIDVQFVVCENYYEGNGVSFGAGASKIEAPFFLTMSDHIFSTDTLKNFVADVKANQELPSLACDANLPEVFDMDDATKVLSKDQKIHDIGKQIPQYDLVDMGLFYFPKGYGQRIAQKVNDGAKSVSDIINQLIAEKGVRTAVIPNACWQDVDNPSMKQEAEKRLAAWKIMEK